MPKGKSLSLSVMVTMSRVAFELSSPLIFLDYGGTDRPEASLSIGASTAEALLHGRFKPRAAVGWWPTRRCDLPGSGANICMERSKVDGEVKTMRRVPHSRLQGQFGS